MKKQTEKGFRILAIGTAVTLCMTAALAQPAVAKTAATRSIATAASRLFVSEADEAVQTTTETEPARTTSPEEAFGTTDVFTTTAPGSDYMGDLDTGTMTTTSRYYRPSDMCGPAAYWSLDEDGVLTISGEGSLDSYTDVSGFRCPWRDPDVRAIVIEEGITDVGYCTFSGCYNAETISLPKTLRGIGYAGFGGCGSVKMVELPENLQDVCTNAFYGCGSLETVIVRNPDCYLDGAETFANATIYGYGGSTAQEFAEQYEKNFVLLDEAPTEPVTTTTTTTTTSTTTTTVTTSTETEPGSDTTTETTTTSDSTETITETTTTSDSTDTTTTTTDTTTETTTETTMPEPIAGDSDGDGVVSVKDAVQLQKYLLSLTTAEPDNWRACDLNGDGSLNVYDLVLLKRMLLQ